MIGSFFQIKSTTNRQMSAEDNLGLWKGFKMTGKIHRGMCQGF